MSDEISSALIGAIGGILSCLLGIKIGKENVLKGIDKSVLENQLKLVYAPIVRHITFCHNGSVVDTVEFIGDVFGKNFELVRPELLDAYLKLTSDSSYSPKKLDALIRMIESNYNWNKKVLKYPYTNWKIDKKHIPTQRIYETLVAFLGALAWLIGVISLPITLMYLKDSSFLTGTGHLFYDFCTVYSFAFVVYCATKIGPRLLLAIQRKRNNKNNKAHK